MHTNAFFYLYTTLSAKFDTVRKKRSTEQKIVIKYGNLSCEKCSPTVQNETEPVPLLL